MDGQLQDTSLKDLLLLFLRRRSRFRVTGRSMIPLLKPGDGLLVDLTAYRHKRPRQGDIVIAWHPHQTNLKIVKRVTSVLDDGSCILLGDNPAESTDSRFFGPIASQNILGKVCSRFP
ncbi:MAG: nickel-type superoxide dismutase maturation protease [Prochloraceae cyanobacterium]